jgi:hypothetical protein
MKTIYSRGSEWRKWDLQIHTPGGKLFDGYQTTAGSNPMDKFCQKVEESDVQVFGITDYFSFDSFEVFTKRFHELYPESNKKFFFNLELRLNETVNQNLEEVNTHLVFNPDSIGEIRKFLGFLKVQGTGKDGKAIRCSDLKSKEDFESATVSRQDIDHAFEETFGSKAIKDEHYLVVTAANNDGLRPPRGKKRKERICDEIDKYSNAFFGGSQNPSYYLSTDRYEDKSIPASAAPVFACSDSHSFEDIDKALGKRLTKEIIEGGKKIDVVDKDVTWIKSDPTYEGLKQILYEPDPGERVSIGPIRPDEKASYKVIRKIRFASADFPVEIEFNENLCSIIGSRSSGKSALLAYLAHSIDPLRTEESIEGPGQGADYKWGSVELGHSIEWANGKSNDDSPGSVVYVPQNYLYDKSQDAVEIKEKITPVLFKVLPQFKLKYEQTVLALVGHQSHLSDLINEWFAASDRITEMETKLRDAGDKAAIELQKQETDANIKILREKYKLSETDLEKYQEASAALTSLETHQKQTIAELNPISLMTEAKGFFTAAKITLSPSSGSLSQALQTRIKTEIEKAQNELLQTANQEVLKYKKELEEQKAQTTASILKINEDNKELLEKHRKNTELEKLVATSTTYAELLKKIGTLENDKKVAAAELQTTEQTIKSTIEKRTTALKDLKSSIQGENQQSLDGIKFDVEYGLNQSEVTKFSQGINLKESTTFVKNYEVDVDEIRRNPSEFLADIYSGKQKANINHSKKDVAQGLLGLTEEILFNAEMEGDKIGGLTQSTMTPGKRALFALRLILAESDDTWPLLIDQPEDDLDSRSIYAEVVPFLRKKKKERQIIMVSHNANLVIGADSEQLVIANRNGNDRRNQDGKQFNYLTGSLEHSRSHDANCGDTLNSQGVCEHACSILDGGKHAFERRKKKYQIR